MSDKRLAIFTICSNNYMAMARVFLESARRFHPDAELYICLADKILPQEGFYPEGCHLISAESLNISEFSQFAFQYDVMEFNTALKPFMFMELVRRGHGPILYFDPDIEIFSPLDDVLERLDQGASFVLTPHLLEPAEGDHDPDDVGIMRAGVYNLGFCGAGSTSETMSILEWWSRRLRYQCVNDQGAGLFVDQKFMDLVPGFADTACILRASRHNVAYWNLAQRSLELHGDECLIDGKNLGFFHFSGFDPLKQDRLSKHSSKFRGAAMSPALKLLVEQYAEKVLSRGYKDTREIRYAYGHFASGAPISAQMRQIFRRKYRSYPGDPFLTFEDEFASLAGVMPPQPSRDELEHLLRSMHSSTSWRLTKPLRLIGAMLRK